MKVLIIDNYDSFTYNLLHYAELALQDHVDVVRNDAISVAEIAAYDKIIISPGPGLPLDAGITMDVIRRYAPEKSILGVCLGHQAIGEVFGCSLRNLPHVHHGVATPIHVTRADSLFHELPLTFNVGRYHSWVIEEKHMPDELEVIAEDGLGTIMAIRHRAYDVKGVQFHPESIMTELGFKIIHNWLFREP